MHNTRNNHAMAASRAFLESMFTEPGTTVSFGELSKRLMTSNVAASPSSMSHVAQTMVEEGFLEQPKKGIYRRPEPKGTPLSFPEPQALTPPSVELIHHTAIIQRLTAIEKVLVKVTEILERQDVTLSEIRSIVAPLADAPVKS